MKHLIKVLMRRESDGRISARAYVFLFGYAFPIGKPSLA